MDYKSNILIQRMEYVKNRTLLKPECSPSQTEQNPVTDVFSRIFPPGWCNKNPLWAEKISRGETSLQCELPGPLGELLSYIAPGHRVPEESLLGENETKELLAEGKM